MWPLRTVKKKKQQFATMYDLCFVEMSLPFLHIL
jgi:hypothetical protein